MSSGSATCILELQPIALPAQPAPLKGNTISAHDNVVDASSAENNGDHVLGELGGSHTDPEPRAERAQTWNESKLNMYKLFSSCVCFFVTGANDAAYGVRTCNLHTQDIIADQSSSL
jgi:hypothetical protein